MLRIYGHWFLVTGSLVGVRFQRSGVRVMETNQKLLSMIRHLFSDTRHLTPETYLGPAAGQGE
jgi:hypothetical protein